MASTGEVWGLGRRPALDGVRGFAVLLVVGTHAHLLPSGGTGVDVFFALSGFLITALLLEERAAHRRLDLRGFYLRRVRRLAPALTVMVAGVLVIGAMLGISSWFSRPSSVVLAMLYLTDFAASAGHQSGALGHTWSLSVEEQFYLLWPVVLLCVGRFGRRALLAVATFAAIASAAWAVALAPVVAPERIGYGIDTRSAPILAGCALAAWMVGRPGGKSRPALTTFATLALAGSCLLVDPTGGAWSTPFAAVMSVLLLWSLVAGRSSGFALFTNAPMQWLGRRSYAVYLWHYPVAALSDWAMPGPPAWLRFAVVLSAALVAAELSWRLVEAPAMRLGRPDLHHSGTAAGERVCATGRQREDSDIGGMGPFVGV